MPNREVHLKRWQAVGVLLLLTLSFVVAIVLVNRESIRRARDNRVLIEAQVQQRAELTYTGCLDQNDRHDLTIKRLDEVLANAIKQDPMRADALRRSRASTVFLIESLAPHQNCEQLVLDRFGFVPKLPQPSGEDDGSE